MAHEKRLLIDVFQAYFYRKKAGGDRELVFMSENLTSGSISSSQENTDVRNGQGNTLFAILPGNKDVTVSLTENVFSFEALELNTAGKRVAGVNQGNSGLISKKAGTIDIVNTSVNIAAPGSPESKQDRPSFALPYVPQRPGDIVLTLGGVNFTRVADGNKLEQGADTNFLLTLEDGTPYELGTPVPKGKAVRVVFKNTIRDTRLKTEALKIYPYVYITAEDRTTTLTVDAKKFAEGGELWLQTIEKDEKQKALAYVYFVFENVIPEGNFEISTVSEVQPNDMTINMRVLANEDGELYRIVREEIAQP